MYSFLGITEEVHLGNGLQDEPIQQVLRDVVAQLRRISWEDSRIVETRKV